jgi:hypothetical protein
VNIIKNCILILLVLCSSQTHAQMQMGIAHDNFNVTEGIRINPALAVDPIPWLDIQLGGLYIFGASNAAYLGKDEFSPLLGKFPNSLSQNLAKDKVNGQIEGVLYGPAVNASIGKFSAGLSTSLRNYAVGRDLSKEFARGLIYGLQIPEYYGDTLSGGPYRAKEVSFLEFAINGGMILHQKGDIVVNIGANFKYLLGLASLNFLADDFSYSMRDSTDAAVIDYSGKYAGSNLGFHPGVGYGIDLGITIEKKVAPSRYYSPHSVSSNCKYLDYKYRFGFSILDLGNIKYKGSYNREVSNASGPWNQYANTRASSIGEVMENLDEIMGSGVTSSSSTYKAKLPLALSLQFDYNFGRGIFLNSTLVYGAALKNSFGGERLSMIAVTPRYEGPRFGLSAPISFNSLGRGGLGLAVRFWYLTIGTDNIGSYIINMDVYRLDVYAHIKIPVFAKPSCKQRGLGEYKWRFSDCSAPGARKNKRRR